MKDKRLSKAKRLPSDIITTLPQPIIETILCLLPIEEATRTSILSKEWRYKWTTIPKLKFSESTVKADKDWIQLSYKTKNKKMRRKLFKAINQVISLRQGPIHEFTLSIDADHTFKEIDRIILRLSRNHTVKKLTFDFYYRDDGNYCLPLSAFSLNHLTDLCLEYCELSHTPLFDGFGSLTILTLNRVMSTKETFLHLLSNCPSLKSLRLFVHLENFAGGGPSIMETFKCLPMIEHLTTWGETIPLLAYSSVPGELPVSLIHLKYCCVEYMDFLDIDAFTFLFVLMKCAPNLEKIKLEIGSCDRFDPESLKLEEYSHIMEEYSFVWLERLNELEFHDFGNLKPELEFVKFILARSPNLKKLVLSTWISEKNEELELLTILLRTPRVSYVEIIVKNRYRKNRLW